MTRPFFLVRPKMAQNLSPILVYEGPCIFHIPFCYLVYKTGLSNACALIQSHFVVTGGTPVSRQSSESSLTSSKSINSSFTWNSSTVLQGDTYGCTAPGEFISVEITGDSRLGILEFEALLEAPAGVTTETVTSPFSLVTFVTFCTVIASVTVTTSYVGALACNFIGQVSLKRKCFEKTFF